MDLNKALEEREAARAAVVSWAATMRTRQEKFENAQRELEEGSLELKAVQQRFVAAVQALHPLLDADAAGVVGFVGNVFSAEPSAAQPAPGAQS